MTFERGRQKYGRGQRTGPDALIDQREIDLLRQDASGDATGLTYSLCKELFAYPTTTSAVGYVADRAYVYLCKPPSQTVRVNHFCFEIIANQAGAIALAGLYHVDLSNDLISLIPESEVTLECTTVGRNTIELPTTLAIVPKKIGLYGFGFHWMANGGGAPTLAGFTSTYMGIRTGFSFVWPTANRLPRAIKPSQAIVGASPYPLAFVYANNYMARLFS